MNMSELHPSHTCTFLETIPITWSTLEQTATLLPPTTYHPSHMTQPPPTTYHPSHMTQPPPTTYHQSHMTQLPPTTYHPSHMTQLPPTTYHPSHQIAIPAAWLHFHLLPFIACVHLFSLVYVQTFDIFRKETDLYS